MTRYQGTFPSVTIVKIALSCIVFWFCGFLFGLIAFIIAGILLRGPNYVIPAGLPGVTRAFTKFKDYM